MRKILQYLLKILSKIVLWKYRPIIAAVTGSVGKTSAKEAIYAVLKNHFFVRRSFENYNNEIGVPLTILGLQTGGCSMTKWFKNLFSGLVMIILKTNYPKILILEMGADKPDDIQYLIGFVPIKIGVLTAIGEFPVHLEFFPEKDRLIEEKAALIKSLPQNGLAVLNYDDLSVRMMRDNVPRGVKIVNYGFGQGADLRIMNYELKIHNLEEEDFGISFKLEYERSLVPIRLKKCLGKQQAYAAAAAAAVGLNFGLNLVDISVALKKYRSLAGRTNLIKGIKNTWIIDDTYNSSPSAAIAALEILNQFQDKRKIAVLGDMLELGQLTEEAHRQVGQEAAKTADMLFTAGECSRFMADEAKKSGFSQEKIFQFDITEEAGKVLQEKLEPGDIVLIKGSRAMRMEKIVKEIMAEPEKAKKLLIG